MFDKNGTLIQAGDIVEIKGAFFKNDNGFWYVERDGITNVYEGGDETEDKDLTLRRIGKTGKLSTAKHNICFWPLCAFVSDRRKKAEANNWNRWNATIEITDKVDNTQVIKNFRKRVAQYKENAAYYQLHGYGEDWVDPELNGAKYFSKALARLEAGKEADND